MSSHQCLCLGFPKAECGLLWWFSTLWMPNTPQADSQYMLWNFSSHSELFMIIKNFVIASWFSREPVMVVCFFFYFILILNWVKSLLWWFSILPRSSVVLIWLKNVDFLIHPIYFILKQVNHMGIPSKAEAIDHYTLRNNFWSGVTQNIEHRITGNVAKKEIGSEIWATAISTAIKMSFWQHFWRHIDNLSFCGYIFPARDLLARVYSRL